MDGPKRFRSSALFLQIKQALKLTCDLFLSGSLQPPQLRGIQRLREKPGFEPVRAGHRTSRHGRHPARDHHHPSVHGEEG